MTISELITEIEIELSEVAEDSPGAVFAKKYLESALKCLEDNRLAANTETIAQLVSKGTSGKPLDDAVAVYDEILAKKAAKKAADAAAIGAIVP